MIIHDQFNRPLKDLRISVIDRCNFRCPYCMPDKHFPDSYQFLEKSDWLSFDEIIRLSKIFVRLGVRKLRITGGEPLLRPNISNLIRELNQISGIEDVALTTNGALLANHAADLKLAGLRRITVSLDTINPKTFHTLSGYKGDIQDVFNGLHAARKVGFETIKLNAVIQRGVNDDDFLDLVEFSRTNGYILRFIEYMDVGNQNHWESKCVVPTQELIENIQSRYQLVRLSATEQGETSQRFAFADGQGELGFISSVSQPFCGTCNRLRLSADGKIYTCLFALEGTDVRSLLRAKASEDEIEDFIRLCWMKRTDRYSQLRHQLHQERHLSKKVEMFHIGG